MLNETQEVAFQNLLVLGETNSLGVHLHGLTLDDAVELGSKLLGGTGDRPQIAKSALDETFIVSGEIEGTKTSFTFFCLPVVTMSPFGPIETAEEVMDRDG